MGLRSFGLIGALGMLAWGCLARSAEPRPMCDAGENIFCKCEGGRPGTKKCAADGASFGQCSCAQQSNLTETDGASTHSASSGGSMGMGGASPASSSSSGGSTSMSSSSSSSKASSSASSGGGGSAGTTALFGACDVDSECKSKKCHDGYCTQPCKQFEDCPWPESECVLVNGSGLCMPTCKTVDDCKKYLAPPSMCGYTEAFDGVGVRTCADWGSNHKLPPDGSTCSAHSGCNLGYTGKERVCSAQKCVAGCFGKTDCPSGKTCTTNGTLGSCK